MYEELIKEVEDKAIFIDVRQLGVWPDAPAATTLTDEGDIVIGLPTRGDPNIIEDLKIHEIGHSVFGHLATLGKNKKAAGLIEKSVNALPDSFSEKYDLDFRSVVDEIAKSALNIVQDFEVNSKLLLEKRPEMDKNKLTSGGMWPEDYDLENGKAWKEYLVDIISNFEDFLDKWIEHLMSMDPEDGEDGDGDGEGKPLTGKDLEEAIKKIAGEIGLEMEDIPGNEELNIPARGKNPSTTKIGTNGTVSVSDECEFRAALEKLFKKRNVYKSTTRGDSLYNMKHGLGEIVKPVYRRDRTLAKDIQNYVILIDVSGSVSPSRIGKFLRGYKDIMEKNNSKASIVSYSDEVEEVFDDINEVEELRIGGNTAGITAVEYAVKHYKGRGLIIVSDFYDNTIRDLMDYKKDFKTIDALNWGEAESVVDAVNRCSKVFDSIINAENV